MLAGSILQDNGFSPQVYYCFEKTNQKKSKLTQFVSKIDVLQGIQGNGASAFSCTDSSIRLLQSKISEVCHLCFAFFDNIHNCKSTFLFIQDTTIANDCLRQMQLLRQSKCGERYSTRLHSDDNNDAAHLAGAHENEICLLYTSPSPRDQA